MRPSFRTIVAALAVAALAAPASAAIITVTHVIGDPLNEKGFFGLEAVVTWTWDDAIPDRLVVTARNTSFQAPAGMVDYSDQVITTISWDFGDPGFNGDAQIISGTAAVGPFSATIDFDNVESQLGPGDDVSGEWGYGNMDGTGALTNFISTLAAQSTPFGGANLDGPVTLDGPNAGMIADPIIVPDGGGGVPGFIQDEAVFTLQLSADLTDLNFLNLPTDEIPGNGTLVEFGSDFAIIPEPASVLLLVIGGLAAVRRRNR